LLYGELDASYDGNVGDDVSFADEALDMTLI